MMKITCLLFLILLHLLLYAQEKAGDTHGSYKKTAHTISGIPAADKAKAIQMIDALVEVVKKAYPDPVGADVGPYSGVFQDYRGGPSEFKNGPYRIYVTIPFYDFYKTKTGGTEASGEYSSNIDIWINNINYILQANSVQYSNGKIYRAPRPGIAVNGFPKYNNMILVLPPGKSLPWKPATKQEYLENFIEGLKHSLPGRSSTPEERQQIPDAENWLASMSPSEKKQPAYLLKWKYGNMTRGYPDFGSQKWAGFLDPSDTTGEQLVVIDENFYDRTLPRNSFQVMVIDRKSAEASMSAARATPQEIKDFNARHERMNSIVHDKDLLPGLQKFLGKGGADNASKEKKKQPLLYSPPKINEAYINRIIDSAFRNYKLTLPQMPGAGGSGPRNVPAIDFPSPNQKKLALAARKLETTQDVAKYLDELEKIFSATLGVTIAGYNNAATNNKAAYASWLLDKPREGLLLALKAAKQNPDQDCLLNNLSAELSLCGIDYLAIPLYIVCIKKEPGNSTIANNLGQSWLGLGEVDKAESYLRQAIAGNPTHHHANNSLGLIYEKQGKKDQAVECYENSLRGSFTPTGINGLVRLNQEKALKLASYVRHRYKQPDYINFDKYPIPSQCTSVDQTELRKAQHEYYQKMIDKQIIKYEKLKEQQKPIAAKALQEVFTPGQTKRPMLRPFQPLATAMVVSLWTEHNERVRVLQKELMELDKEHLRLKLEFDTALKAAIKPFEERMEKEGEGNVDPSLDEELCEAKSAVGNYYLPLFAENNEQRFTKIIHAHKDYLNDYLYWVRLSSYTTEEYLREYYDIVLSMYRLLREVRLTTLFDVCENDNKEKAEQKEAKEMEEPDCVLPVGVEIPFVIGKIVLNCDGWGVDGGEIIKFTLDHKIGGETTIAFGAGYSFYETPKLFGHKSTDLNPGIDSYAKGQAFITFDGYEIMDWGLIWEAEIDLKGLGKPAELKQDFVFSVNKGFYADGILTNIIDKYLDIPPEKQVNKNIKIYNPHQ